MHPYAEYFRVKHLSTPIQKSVWMISFALLAVVVFLQDVLRVSFGTILASSRVPWAKVLFFAILLTGSLFAIQRYVGSPEYRYFRSLPLPNPLRSFALLTQGLPFYGLYGFLACLLSGSGETLAVVQLLYGTLLMAASSTLTSHGILSIQTWARRNPRVRPFLLLACAFPAMCVLLAPGLLPGSLPGDGNIGGIASWINLRLLSPHGYGILPCLLWLGYYSARTFGYEPGFPRKRAFRRSKKIRLRQGLYPNLLYKDLLLSAANPLIVLVYVLAATLAVLSAMYRLDASVNGAILLISVFVGSTLSEELMKHDMASLAFLRTLPFSQGAFFRAKIGSVSTALALPPLLFLGISGAGGAYSLRMFGLLAAAALVMNTLLCAMQCAIIMGHAAHPEKIQLSLAASIFCTLFCPLWPLLYVLVAWRKAKRAFCGGRE